jgi:hypothetical protein
MVCALEHKISEDKLQAIYFSHTLRPLSFILHWVDEISPSSIMYYSLFKSERLSANVKLNLHTELIRSVMTYACPPWELAAASYLLKLQRLQNKILRTIGNCRRCTSIRDLFTVFNLPYGYDYIIKLCRQQADVIQNHENEHVRSIGQDEARHRKYKRLKLGDGQAYDRWAAVVA